MATTNYTFLNFKYGNQASLPAFAEAEKGAIYVTKDTNRLFIALPESTDYVNTGDFQLVSFTTGTAEAALNAQSLKRENILYITVDKDNNTAMWRYNGTEFVAISNSKEIADIVSDISDLNTAIASLEGKVIHYGVQDYYDSASSEIKDINCADNFALYEGALLSVYMHEGNTHQHPQLSINGEAPHELRTNEFANFGDSASNWSSAGHVLFVYYDNAWWVADSELRRRVKEIKNTADAAMPRSGGTFTGAVTILAPTEDSHAATKLYVDSAVGDINTEIGNINNDLKNYMPKNGGTFSGEVTFATGISLTVNEPTANGHAASKGYVDTKDAETLAAANEYTNAAKSAILGKKDDSTEDFNGTVKGAYAEASAAATAASNAQKKADDAYILAGQKTTTAEVKAQIEKYGYATTSVAQSKADAAQANAKTYTDEQIGTVNTTISTLKSDIGNLSNIMNFLGTTTTEIVDGTTTTINKPSAVTDATYTPKDGDVVVDSKGKECVYDGAKWRVIGDTSANSTAITNLQNTVGTKPNSPGMDNTLWEEVADLRTDLGESNDDATKTTTAFGRIAALEAWKVEHTTNYTDLSGIVSENSKTIEDLVTILAWGTF